MIKLHLIPALFLLPFFGVSAQSIITPAHLPEKMTFKEARKATKKLRKVPQKERDCEKIIKYAHKTVELAEKEFGQDDYHKFGRSLTLLSHSYFACGDPENAKSVLTRYIDKIAADKGSPHHIAGHLSVFKGRLFASDGDFEKALKYCLEGLDMIEKTIGKDTSLYYDNLRTLSDIYHKSGQFDKALETFDERKKIFEVKFARQSQTEKALARLYRDMGQYEKALPIYLNKLKKLERREGKDVNEYGLTLYETGKLYLLMGQNEKALSVLLRASENLGKNTGEESGWYGKAMNALGEVYTNLGDYDKALFSFQIAYENYVNDYHKDHPNCALYLSKIAGIYGLKGRYKEAYSKITEALIITEKTVGKESPDYAERLFDLANLYQIFRQYEAAIPPLQGAFAIIENSLNNTHPLYSLYAVNLAINQEAAGQIESAADNYFRANDNALFRLRKQFDYFSENEQAALFFAIEKQFAQFQSFAFRHPEYRNLIEACLNNTLTFKGLLLNNRTEMLRILKNNQNSKIAGQYAEWETLKSELARQFALPVENRKTDFQVISEYANELESNLARASKKFKDNRHIEDWKRIQSQLSEGEAALEFAHFDYYRPGKAQPSDSIFYVAYLLKKGENSPQIISLFEEKELGNIKAAVRLYNFQKRGKRSNLFELIAQPILPHLGDISTIYFSPTGVLHRLNLGAIPISETQTFADRFELHRLGSTRQLLNQSESESLFENSTNDAVLYGGIQYNSDSTALLSGNSDLDFGEGELLASRSLGNAYRAYRGGNWQYLKWTEKEINDLEIMLESSGNHTKIFSNYAATEESFKHFGKSEPSPKIIHLATHGYFFPDPKNSRQSEIPGSQSLSGFQKSEHPMIRSGIILAGANRVWKGGEPINGLEDGILTAYEIAEMDLSNTELVVLSACETGLGDLHTTEGVYGLQRAFKLAGAKYILMSLWSVDDQNTYEFMTNFYREWKEHGKSIREAYQKTQLKLKERYSQPFDPHAWAGFILVE